MRERISLDGLWLFQYDAAGDLTPQTVAPQREIFVPMPWQAQCADLRYKGGIGWYVRHFSLDALPDEAAILHFGAVDYHASVWLNGVFVGQHEGGYLPFEFEVAGLLRAAENELVVRVADLDDAHAFAEIPHGKQSWYGPLSGIWQSVWLELRARRHLYRLRLTPDCARGAIAVQAGVSPAAAGSRLLLQVRDPWGRLVGRHWIGAPAPADVPLDAPVQRWTLEQPALYTVTAELWHGEHLQDRLEEYCGFRTVAARDGRIYLNEEPLYLRGALDQGYYPYTIYTPPDVQFLEVQARKAKALGLNCLRSHIKIEDPRYYDVADRLGLLVWAELPSWGRLTAASQERAEHTFRHMVERDWNHPSIFAWSLVNEDWGTDLVHDASHRRWLAGFYRQAKELDPTRLIVDNSPCAPNFHVASDLEDYHHYRVMPDHAAEWDEWLQTFAAGAGWAWASDYDANRHAGLPRIVSEFGQWGLPHPERIQENGAEPWWFEDGFHWGDGAVYPHGLQQRFHFWGLTRVFGSFDRFIAAHQQQMARGLKNAIAAMRRQPDIGGYVITEFTDVHWEANGLLDMQRNAKQHLDALVPLNQDRVVLLRPQSYSGAPGAEIAVQLEAFDVDGPAREGELHWSCAQRQGQIPAPGGLISVTIPANAAGTQVELQASWVGQNGQQLATNRLALVCPRPPSARPPLHVVGDDALSVALPALGYPQAGRDEPAIWVSRQFTSDCRQALNEGGRLLLIADGEDDRPLPAGQVTLRDGSGWQGDWATSFSWLRRDGPFAGLPGGPLLDMSFLPVMPRAVIASLPAWLVRDHSWAGLAVGWLHKHVSLLATMRYGQGLMAVTTFRLAPEILAEDAVAQTLFAGMLTLLAAEH